MITYLVVACTAARSSPCWGKDKKKKDNKTAFLLKGVELVSTSIKILRDMQRLIT